MTRVVFHFLLVTLPLCCFALSPVHRKLTIHEENLIIGGQQDIPDHRCASPHEGGGWVQGNCSKPNTGCGIITACPQIAAPELCGDEKKYLHPLACIEKDTDLCCTYITPTPVDCYEYWVCKCEQNFFGVWECSDLYKQDNATRAKCSTVVCEFTS